jgi:hypothetical protein
MPGLEIRDVTVRYGQRSATIITVAVSAASTTDAASAIP